MNQPAEVMTVAWGPFARQCTDTRTSNYVIAGRKGPSGAVKDHRRCFGFSAAPAAGGAVQVTISEGTGEASSDPLILRILRRPDGVTRPAASRDTGLLAQGSDEPGLAEEFARYIGIPHQQTINPEATLVLPIRLVIQFPIEDALSCRPDGGAVDRGRQTLVLACTLDNQVHSDRIDARVQLAGVEEIDILTGVRISSELVGSVTGHDRPNTAARWREADYHVWYSRTTDFE